MRRIWLLLLGLMVLVSCGKKPKSSFTVDKSEVVIGESVQFTSTSTEAVHFHWKFGDGSESREANPVHIFEKTGTFSVTLHVSNKGGDYWDTSDPIPVSVYGYNSSLIGNWSVTEIDTADHCGISFQYYNLSISKGGHENELNVSNLGNFFSAGITGNTVTGDLNKIQIYATNVLASNGKYYTVNGSIRLVGPNISILYYASPSSSDTCGIRRSGGTGVH